MEKEMTYSEKIKRYKQIRKEIQNEFMGAMYQEEVTDYNVDTVIELCNEIFLLFPAIRLDISKSTDSKNIQEGLTCVVSEVDGETMVTARYDDIIEWKRKVMESSLTGVLLDADLDEPTKERK